MNHEGYLDRQRRSLEQVIAARIMPADRITHSVHGVGTVSSVIGDADSPIGPEAIVRFDDGVARQVTVRHCTKVPA